MPLRYDFLGFLETWSYSMDMGYNVVQWNTGGSGLGFIYKVVVYSAFHCHRHCLLLLVGKHGIIFNTDIY